MSDLDAGLDAYRVRQLFKRLVKHYGPQSWWPADTPFEVMVGAVLTQNTAWPNVEKAIDNLKAADALDADVIVGMRADRLAKLIRPSGYFNIKAKRLKACCQWYVERGGFEVLSALSTKQLRDELLNVHGIGPETADDIMLYAFERPCFVIDTYTRRIFSRIGFATGDEPYDTLRVSVEKALKQDVVNMNEFHAVLVEHAKACCRKKPVCDECFCCSICAYA